MATSRENKSGVLPVGYGKEPYKSRQPPLSSAKNKGTVHYIAVPYNPFLLDGCFTDLSKQEPHQRMMTQLTELESAIESNDVQHWRYAKSIITALKTLADRLRNHHSLSPPDMFALCRYLLLLLASRGLVALRKLKPPSTSGDSGHRSRQKWGYHSPNWILKYWGMSAVPAFWQADDYTNE